MYSGNFLWWFGFLRVKDIWKGAATPRFLSFEPVILRSKMDSVHCIGKFLGHWQSSGPINDPERVLIGHHPQESVSGQSTGPGDLDGNLLVFSYNAAKEHEGQNTFEEMEKNLDQIYLLVNAARMNRGRLLVITKPEDMTSQFILISWVSC